MSTPIPKARISGVCAIATIALAVAIDDETADVAAIAADEMGATLVRVAHGPAGCEAIADFAPRIVFVGTRLWRSERADLDRAARVAQIILIELPPDVTPSWIVRAMLAATYATARPA